MFAVFCLSPFCSEGQIWARIILEQNITPELVPAGQLPRYGTFWSLQRTNCPPLPFCPFPELPVYWINKERNVFLLDDRSVDYQALYQQRLAARMLEAAALGMSLEELESMEGGGGGGGAA